MDNNDWYKNVCEKRFDDHQRTIDIVDKKVDDLITTVNNGLSSRVKRIDRLMWLLITGIILEAVIGRIF